MKRIAILLTSHNRKDITSACLGRLFSLIQEVDVYITDDASTDGTEEEVKRLYPSVNIIHGNGNLFWCRGMNSSWMAARKKYDYDYYVWLNDDLLLYDNAFEELIACSSLCHDESIISGLVQGTVSKRAIYGGYDIHKKLIEPNGVMQPIHHLNGNFVIIPKCVFNKLGFFDKVYHHDIGDVDYGFLAQENGIEVLTTRCFIGSSEERLKTANLRIRTDGMSLKRRLKKLYSPLGANPFVHFHFDKKHKGLIIAILDFIYLHLINFIPDNLFYFLFPKYKK